MAEFDPNKIPIIDKAPRPSVEFNPDDVPFSRNKKEELKRRLTQGMQQRMLSTEDFGKGMRAGLQNIGAYATSALPQSMQVPRYDPQPTSSYGQSPIEAGKIVSSFAPGVGAEKAVSVGLGAIEQIPSWLSRMAGGAAGGAASAPAVDVSPTTGAAFGLAGAAIPESVMGLVGKYLGKNVTPEQFESARKAIPENIKSPIGELADSPRAKTRYGKARGIALSQADTPYQQLYDHLNQETKSLTADAPSVDNPSQYVYGDVKKSYESAKSNTNKAYDKLSAYGDKNDVPFDNKDYLRNINDSLDEIKKRSTKLMESEKPSEILSDSGVPFTKKTKTRVQFNEDIKDLYAQSVKTLNNFKKTPIETFTDATQIRKSLNKLIKKRYKTDDLESASFLQNLKSGLDSSIAKSSKSNPTLMNLHESANSARIHQGTYEKLNKDNPSPFYKRYVKDGAPDGIIGEHIRTSTKGDDFSGLLGALTEKLSPKAKGVLAKAHLQPTEDTSLAKQIGKIKKLSPTQRDLMFGDKAPAAHSISKIAGLYPSAASADFTPTTGYTGAKLTQLLAEMGGLSSGVGVGAATHSPAIIAGTAATASALPAIGQITQRALRSEALKDAYMKYLQRSGKGALTKATPTGQSARTALLSALGGNQNGA